MSTVLNHPCRPARKTLVATGTALVLFATAPGASADPVDPADLVGESHGVDTAHDHEHGPHDSVGLHGDHFGEALVVPKDPFVVDPGPSGPLAPATEPLAWRGAPPDPADLPADWLEGTEAEVVDPSTPEELMSADTGYLAQFGSTSDSAGADSAGTDSAAPDAVLDSVPAPPRKSLPATLDAEPGWQYTYSCDPNNKPGMVAFAQLISKHYNRPTFYTSRTCIAGDNSQHYDGRAVDWPMNAFNAQDKAIGDAVAQWLTANNGEMARRFGVMSVIWNKKSWYLYSPGTWRAYTGPSPHTDHLHISFTWDGAMKRTSWWTGTPVTTVDHGTCRVYTGQYAPRYTARRTSPCPTVLPQPPASPYPVVLPNAKNSHVTRAQQYLGLSGSAVDGSFGPATLSALLAYQGKHGLPRTGVLDNATWAKMIQVGFPGATPAPNAVSRVQGNDRYATAAALAEGYPVGRDVYVTTGGDFPDALAASARAGAVSAPVLLTKKSGLPGPTASALRTLRPKRIFVVGGTGVISSTVASQLRSYASTGTVTRISGTDRYDTAGHVARQFGSSVPVVYVATGLDYPDAMSGAARAGYNDGPVLLTQKDGVPAATLRAMRDIRPARVVVLGGTTRISDRVANQLAGLTRNGSVQRVAGDNRYDTAALIADYYPKGLDVVYVSTGVDYPDALAGSARAGANSGPMVLTRTGSLPGETKAVLRKLDPKQIVVVGGSTAVTDSVVRELRNL